MDTALGNRDRLLYKMLQSRSTFSRITEKK